MPNTTGALARVRTYCDAAIPALATNKGTLHQMGNSPMLHADLRALLAVAEAAVRWRDAEHVWAELDNPRGHDDAPEVEAAWEAYNEAEGELRDAVARLTTREG